MRKDSELFLRKLLEYREELGKDSFEIKYQDYKEIPSIETAIFDILEDLIKNNCLTSQSEVTDLKHVSINLTLDGIVYFDEAKTKENSSNYIFNVAGGHVNIAEGNGHIDAVQNNNYKSNDDFKDNSKKFKNNKKQDYFKIWNSRLFLHLDNDERPLTLADAFIMPDCKIYKSVNRMNFDNNDTLDIIIDKFLKYNQSSTMLITGVPGIGKSSITSWIANKYNDDDNNNIIILRFRDWESEELENGLLKAIYNTLECRKRDLECKILVLDGFDEMKSLAVREEVLNSFFADIKDFANFKCIITSRPAYINHTYLFGVVLELKEFNISKVKEFCGIITGNQLRRQDKIESNLDVLGIPVILYMAIMSNIDIGENPTKPELYNRIFAEKGGIFDRFYDGNSEYGIGKQILRNAKNIKKYLAFLGDTAFKMFEKDSLSLQKGECQVPTLEFEGMKINVLEFPIKHLFETTKDDIEFIHKSVYEYFVSEYIFLYMDNAINEVEKRETELASVFGSLLKCQRVDSEILEFLKYKIVNSRLNSIFEIVNKTFQLMLQSGMTYFTKERYENVIDCEMTVFVNMLEIIHLWEQDSYDFDFKIIEFLVKNEYKGLNLNKVNFYDESLKGVHLKGAYFEGADLRGADLRRADLERANLKNVSLRGADLREGNLKRVDLRKADLSHAKIQDVMFEGAQLDELTLDYEQYEYLKKISVLGKVMINPL